ncbi:MAG TPA: sugar phosphate isomerase/epimerase family protein, partial [Thermomicrobiales bacterium]|nr:sugar phosphate isomerase/epimerase family protein [Thermomicrobiales bacterium]
MVRLSGFGDEISTDLDEQLDVLQQAGIDQLDVRGAWGKNVLALSNAEVATIRESLAARGMRASCVATPVGKAPVDGNFAEQQDALARGIDVAHALDTTNVRIFSYYIPDGDEPEQYRDEIIRRLRALVEQAQASGVTLLHENERGIYGDSPARCHELHATIDSPHFLALWDPGNFASCGYRPFHDSWDLLHGYIGYVHVKDYNRAAKRVVVAGAGDAEWPDCLRALRDSGYDGVISLEPHLAVAGKAGGF